MASTIVRPGANTIVLDKPTPKRVPTDTGLAGWIGLTERGPVAVATEVSSLRSYVATYGDRSGNETFYDSVETFFSMYRRGGPSRLVISRVVGVTTVKATKTLNDRAGAPLPTIRVDADSVGTWANSLTIDIANGVAANTFVVIVKRSGVEVERSYELVSPLDAKTWSAVSKFVRVVDLGSVTVAPNNNPAVVANQALIGGTDDRATAADAQWNTALAAFTKSFGPMQVAAPGRTTQQMHRDITVHCNTIEERTPILDAPDTDSVSTLDATLDALRAGPGDESYAGVFGPWLIVPGLTQNTQRTVPPSAAVCAAIARSDAAFGHANVAAAGDNAQLPWVLGVTQSWSDADRQTLNETGLNVIGDVFGIGSYEIYGWRTAADPVAQPRWWQLNWQRFRMQLRAEGQSIGKPFVFRLIDGGGGLYDEFKNAWNDRLKVLHRLGALFGEAPEDAYHVEVGAPVNTTATAAAGELNAEIEGKFSPTAEQVTTYISSVSLTEELAA